MLNLKVNQIKEELNDLDLKFKALNNRFKELEEFYEMQGCIYNLLLDIYSMISVSQLANKIILIHAQTELYNNLGLTEKSRIYQDFENCFYEDRKA